MDRRTFVASVTSFCLCFQRSGCLGDGTDKSDEGPHSQWLQVEVTEREP